MLAIARPAKTATISARIPNTGTSAAYANDCPNSQISHGFTVWSPVRKKSNEPGHRRSSRIRPSPTAASGASTSVTTDHT